MPSDPTQARDHRGPHQDAPEAELPQAPPGAPEGHDAVTPGARGGSPLPPPGTIPPVGADVPEQAAPAADGPEPEPAPSAPEAGPGPGPAAAPAGAPLGAPGATDFDALTARAQKADEYLALAQRTQADFENYRKRAVREAASAQERGAVKLALALLPAIDNLDRALAHADAAVGSAGEGAGNGAASLIAGLKHVHADVISAFGQIGIERYSPEGEAFDPQFHEAVAQQPVEGAEPGTVVEVFQQGYRLGDNVVRPARVVVAG